MSSAKYEGPHSGFRSTCDVKIEDWYLNDQTEHKDNKNDNKFTVDAKFKHSKGFVRTKLYCATDRDGDAYQMKLSDDAIARIKWGEKDTHIEFKGGQFYYETDLGSKSLANGKLFVNPYVRWESERDFGKNSLRAGGVFRYSNLMLRAQLRLANLLHDDREVHLDAKSHFIKNEWSVETFKSVDLKNKALNSWKVLAGWQNNTYGALVHASDVKGTANAGAYLIYKHNKDLSLGTKYDHGIKNRKPGFVLGGQWLASKDTTIRKTLNAGLDMKTFLSHRLNSHSSLMCNFETNLKQFLPEAEAYKGYMGYPFKWGMVLKIDA